MHWLPACPANRFSQTLHQALHTLDVDGVAYASASVAAAAVLLSSNLGTPLPLSSCKRGRQMHSEPTKAKLTIHKSCNVVSHKIHILVYGLKAANMPVVASTSTTCACRLNSLTSALAAAKCFSCYKLLQMVPQISAWWRVPTLGWVTFAKQAFNQHRF